MRIGKLYTSLFTALKTANSAAFVRTVLLAGVLLCGVQADAQTTTSFAFTGAVQSYTVPVGVTSIKIAANGAQGGSTVGGLGAIMVGTFNVVPGHVLNIIAGAQGIYNGANSSGGGGSFVWDVTASNNLLIAAGGGGGGRPSCWTASGSNASSTTTPTPGGAIGSGSGGTGGNGGAGGNVNSGLATAGGGCGWISNGANGTGGSAIGGGGFDPLNGGAGGFAGSSGSVGGFGGGGGSAGSCGACGGGGGYNGGGGGNDWDNTQWGTGGGGGSFNGGTTQSNSVGNTGNGVVVITTLISPASFNNGSSQSLSVCENSIPTSINSNLTASGGTGNYTWTVVTSPSHGSISGLPTSNATGTSVTPSVTVTYQPTGANYVGSDAFVIQVQESGTSTTALTTVNVTVTGPNVGTFIPAATNSCQTHGDVVNVTSSIASGTYTVTYNMSGSNTATGSTASMTMSAGTGSFTTSALASTGSTTITITSITDGSGCIANLTTGNTTSTTTYPNPSTYAMLGGGSYCSGGTGVTVGLSNSDFGVNYQLYDNGSSVGSPVSGSFSSINFGSETAAGTYTVIATNSTSGCTTTMSGTAVVSINPIPVAQTMTESASSYCSGGSGITMGLASSELSPTTTYQLYNGATAVGSPVTGTGGAIVLPTVTAASVYSVVGTYSGTGCKNGMANSETVSINPLPVAQTVVASNGGHYCAGGTGVNITLSTTETGVNYALKLSGVTINTVTGTGGTVTLVSNETTAGTYNVVGTNTTTTCTNNMANTVTVVIDPLPAAITGTNVVCVGQNTTLNDATSGGQWSSSNTFQATIGSGTGIATGVAGGIPNITFTVLATGCYVTTPLTVNALPSAITGPNNVCVGLSTTALSSTPTGGSWASSNTAVGTVGISSGIVTGILQGTTNITYTNTTTGCYITAPFTVNPVPAAITGTASVCVNATTSLNDATTGGTWSSNNPGQGSVVGAGTSVVVTGVSAGTPVISYTLPTGCYATVPVTVNALPGAITGSLFICNGTVGAALTDGSGPGTWVSGNTGVATIGSSSGIITTAGSGNSTITYSLTGTGCSVTAVLTVNALPAAIGGPTAVCVGQTITLTDAGGGTWTSGNPSFATVGSSTGVVTGVAGGSPVITYTAPSGCQAFLTITVNTLPAAIAGANSVCVASTATATDGSGPGTWASSNTAVATVDPTTGVVTGVAQGNPTLTFTITATGCFITGAFTVNALPTTPTGSAVVCVNSSTTLSSTPAGGIWSSSIPTQATVGSTTGTVTGVAAGNPSIIYTLPTGCISSVVATVNPLPAAITGTLNVCTGLTTTLSDATTGGTWSSTNTALGSVGTTGIVSGIAVGVPFIAYTLPTGCLVSTPLTVNQTPVAITGTTNTCIGTSTTLADATAGGTWLSSNSAVGSVSTTGVVTGLTSGPITITYLVIPTGCLAAVAYSVNPLPAAITGTMNVCVSLTTTLADATTGGTWTSSNTAEGTVGSSTGIVGGISAGTPSISYTLPSGCIATALVTVNALPTAITGTPIVCTGFNTTLASTPSGGLWTSGATGQATIGSTSGIMTGVGAGNPTITYALPTGCIATVVATINQTPAVITGTTNVCVGLTTTLNDATTLGSWSSNNTAEATVTSGGGVVTGNSAGVPILSYIMPTGCYVTTPVTVNPVPAAITGPTAVCTGATIGLNDITTGGLWTTSDPTRATVGSTSGVVTGVAFGLPNISYTLPTGCYSIALVSVNTTPAVITGSTNVCTGSSMTLADATTGGTWISSNTSEATITSGGVVTGVATGTPIISYVSPAACYVTYPVTVNQTPVPTTGTPSVCVSLTTTLSDATTGGLWTTSNPAMATVGSTTGIVTGTGAGTPNITYTMPTGCNVITPITVNPIPAAITGTMVVCAGSSVTLNDVTSGGIWTSGNTSVATVGTTSGITTGVAAGAAGITYTLGAGCFASAVVTVNAVPNISSFSSPTATGPCVGANSVVTVNSTSLGTGTFTVTYNLSGANTATSSTATLTMGTSTGTFTIPSSSLTNVGSTTVTIVSIFNTFGCNSNPSSSNTATFNVNALPTVYTVTGGGGYCSGGTGVHIGLSNSVGGINYQLYFGATATGSPITGTFSGLDFGLFTAVGTYTVNATNITTGCFSNMSGSATVSINPLPVQYNVTGGGAYCAGGTGVAVGLSNSETGKNYQLYDNGTPVGTPFSGTTGSAINFGLETGSGTYTVVATDAVTTCTNTMTGSAGVTINPLPSAISGSVLVCVASTTTLTDVGGGTWTSGTPANASIGSATGVVTGLIAGTSVITYTLPTGCTTTTVVTVNPLPAAIAGPATVCVAATAALTDATGTGTWTSSNTLLATVGLSTGTVTGVAAGNVTMSYSLATGCSVIYPMTVNPIPAAIAGSNNVCAGLSTTLTNTVSGGVWSSTAPSNASIGSATGIVNGVLAGTATISYTLPAGCSATLPFTVNPTPAAIGGTTNTCVGAGSTLTDATTGGGWTSSNTAVATAISTTGLITGVSAGSITITYTLPAGCTAVTPFTVNPIPAAITGTNNVCQGLTTSLFDATSGGSWTSSNTSFATIGSATGIVNGVAAGSATITYTLPAGSCTAIYGVTVNPLPAAITGTLNVCTGLTTALSDATSGGTWSSSNATLGSVGTTGIVAGLSAGIPFINYTLPTGCSASTPVTVNPLPAAITGVTTVCAGSSVTLNDASAGGSWTSGNIAIATAASTTGVVTGVANGNTAITYTLPTGCLIATNFTVNPAPAAITGTPSVCLGSTTALADATSGGTWTSSNTALGTVSTTGVVTGIAVGTPTITYTLPLGCNTTLLVSVNPVPSAITGVLSVCTGANTTLLDGVSGGNWTSAAPLVATVGSTTGVVNGVSAGTVVMTYTLPAGCFTVATVTINQTPVAITGANNVCVASTTTLGDLSTGGVWTSSNTSQATIGSLSGTVLGVAAGSPFITYTLPAGCNTTFQITVNPLPAAITGANNVCAGSNTTLSDATTGGTWTSSNVSLASIGSSTGNAIGISAGPLTFTYTLPTTCLATFNATVNALPTVFSVLGGGSYCSGGTGIDVSTSGSQTAISYQLKNSGTTVATSVGTGGTIDYGLQTAAGLYTVVATNTLTACSVNMSSSATVSINALPNAFNMTGGGAYCTGGTGVVVGLASSETGKNYQLYRGTTAVGALTAGGAGTPISFGLETSAGTYTVVAYNAVTACSINMLSSAVVSVNPLPTAFTVTGGGSICSGATGVHVGLSGATVGVTYILSGVATATVTPVSTGAVDFGIFTTPGIYAVTAINLSTGCTNTMSGTATISVNALPAVATLSASASSFCLGGTGVTLNLSSSVAGINYQLYLNNGISNTAIGAPIPGGTLSFGLETGTGTYTAIATSSITTCTVNMTGAPTVTTNALPTAYSVGGGGAYCSGGSGLYVTLASTDLGITYKLTRTVGTLTTTVSTITPGTSGVPITTAFGLQTIAGTYGITATNAAGCSINMTGTTIISVAALPVQYAMTGGGNYCAGGTGLPVGLSSSDAGVNYQLYYNGVSRGTPVAGVAGTAISFGLETLAGTYSVVATNAATLCTNNMLSTVIVAINPLPTVFTITGGGSYCTSSSTGVLVGLTGQQSGISYQLYNGTALAGSAVLGSGSGPLSFGIHSSSGIRTAIATNPLTTCSVNMLGSATVVINTPPAPFPVSGGGSYCAGTTTGVHILLGGSATGVSYQLYNGSVMTGAAVTGTTGSIDFGTYTTTGTYTVVATGIATGCTATMTGTAVISVNPLPNLYTVTGGGSYCLGTGGLAVGLSGSDTGVTYQLYNGGATAGLPVAGTGTTISFGLHTSGGLRTAIATNNITGCTNTMTGGVSISINPLPVAYPISGGGGICAGGPGVAIGVSTTALGINYQLYNGSSPVGAAVAGTAGGAISFGLETATGTYTVVGINASTTCATTMTGTAIITINPAPTAYTVTGGGGYCVGTSGIAVGLSNSTVGVSYQLYAGTTPSGVLVPGTGTAINFGLETTTGVYTVTAVNVSSTCTNNMTGSVIVSLNAVPVAYTVTGGGSYCAGGTGLPVGLSGSGTGISYQLYKDGTATGSPLAGTGSAISFGAQTATSSTYTVIGTSVGVGGGCTANMTGSVTINTNPLPNIYGVSGGGAYCSGSAGVHVGLTVSDAGINYQLYRAGTGAGAVGSALAGTGSALDFGLETVAGTYTVVATDAVSSCTSNMSVFAIVSVNALPATFSVSGGGAYCAGGTGELVGLSGSTATGVTYQLYNGGTAVGTAMAGTGSALSFGMQTAAGTYTIIATNSATLCTSSMLSSATIVVNPLPSLDTVTGGGNYCPGGSGLHIGLSGSTTGINYQLLNGTTLVAFPVPGTGSALDFGAQTITGTYFVTATNPATGCSISMTGGVPLGISTLPVAYSTMGSATSYCFGGTGVDVTLSGSNLGINYQLYRNGTAVLGSVMPGTSFPINFGMETSAGTYTVVATSTATGCSNNMLGTPAITVNSLPLTYTVTGGGSYCAGGAGEHISVSGSEVGVNYQLYNGATATGTPMAGTGFSVDFGALTAAGTYTVTATNATTGCSSGLLSSAVITVNSAPTAYHVDGGGAYCSGGTGVHIGLSASDLGVNYQLYNGTTAISGPVAGLAGSASVDFGLQTVAGSYTVKATNATSGCMSMMTDTVSVIVNPMPAAFTVTGGGNYCISGAGVHIGLSGSATGVSYQLNMTGTGAVGSAMIGTGGTIDFGAMTVAGTYSVAATNTTGCTADMTGSVAITVSPLPTIYPVSGGGHYCSTTAGSAIYLDSAQSGVNYQLYDSSSAVGAPVGGSTSGITFGLHAAGDYTVVGINATTGCTSNMANNVISIVDIAAVPAVTVTTSTSDTVCAGTYVTFSATATNGGITPTYVWYVNGVATGSTTDTYGFIPTDGEVVSVTMTSSLACVAPATATNSVSMVVRTAVTPSVTIAASTADTICRGTSVNLVATAVNGGTSPSFNWYVHGGLVASGPNYSYVPSNGDVIFATLESSNPCSTSGSALSNNIRFTVDSNTPPAVSVNVTLGAIAGNIAYGNILTATVSNGGNSPVYQWLINGVVVSGANAAVLNAAQLNNGDIITCIVSNTNACGVLSGSATTTVTIGTNVGVKTVATTENITLVPNPNKGSFIVKGSLGTTDDVTMTMEVTDVIGQVIYTNKVIVHNGIMNEAVQLNNVANGMYIMTLRSDAENKVFHIVVEQ